MRRATRSLYGGRLTQVIAAASLAALLLTACGGDQPDGSSAAPAPEQGGSEEGAANHWPEDAGFENDLDSIVAAAIEEPALHYCTGYRDDEWALIYEPFQEAYPEIKEIEISTCQGTGPRQRVFTEWSTGAFDVGLFDVAGDSQGQFEDAELGAIPDFSIFEGTDFEIDPETIAPSGRVFGLGATSRVFLYNENMISAEELPDSFEECADPKYKGQFIMDVRPSGGYNALLTELGEEGLHEWALGIAANEPLWARAPAPTNQALLSGERAWVCGSQIHGPFLGFIEAGPDGTIPEGQTLNAKPNTDNAHTPARVNMMIGNYTESPNTALLFSAFQLSGKGPGPAGANPGYGDPWLEGSWKQMWFEDVHGVEVLDTEGGRWNDANLTEQATQVIVDAWQDPVPVITE